jgi:hypothetical protein
MQQGGEDRISEREPIDDRFIPVRLEAIVDAVTPDAQSAGVSAVAVTKFVDALRACVDQETAAFRRRLDVLYDPFNPDRDTTIPDYEDAHKSDEAMRKLLHCVEYLMDKANFTSMSEVHIEQAIQAASTRGIRVRFDASMIDSLTLWVRGIGRTMKRGKSVRHPIRGQEKQIEFYRRLVVLARLKEEDDLLLKMFRNIPTADLEALLPHAQVSMNWFDRAKVAVGAGGALGSIGAAVTKAATAASLGLFNLLYVLGLPFLVLGWRSFSGYRRALNNRDSQRTKNLYYLNLASNWAVLSTTLARTSQEETKEAAILYLYLLICQQHPAGTEEGLCRQVERFLRDHFDLHCSFDCPDAMETLDRFELWSDRNNYCVIPIDEAVAKLRTHYAQRRTCDYHERSVEKRATQSPTSTGSVARQQGKPSD